MKNILIITILFLTIVVSQANETDFNLYVPKNIQKKCNGLDDICKTFYTGYYLLDYRYKASLSLKYLVESYEKNASKVVENMEAKNYYLSETIARLYEGTGHYDSAIKFYKLSTKAGNERAICYEGSVYMKQGQIKKAFKALKEGASKHYVECYLDLGRYYFNDEFGVKNKMLGGEYWKLSYEDDSYGIAENYNMGVYSEYKKDDVKNKYYTLKAAKMGDKDALRFLGAHLKNISTTKLFLEEALGSHFWNVRERNNREFSNNYDLYYRLKKMFNHDARWVEDHDYEDKRWNENQDNVVKFDKGLSSLVFESKKIILQTKVTSRSRNEIFSKDIELLYKILFVDLSGVQNVVDLHHELVGRILQKKSFEYSREFSVDGYGFVWYGKYDAKSKELLVRVAI